MSQISKTPKLHLAHALLDKVPEEKSLVRVFNKSEGALKHDVRVQEEKDGPIEVISYEIKGGSFASVPKAVADLWLRDFPNRIIGDSDAQKLVNGAQAESTRLQAELDKVNAQLAAVRAKSDPKGELARLQKELAEVTEKNASLQADLEKATAPTPESSSGV